MTSQYAVKGVIHMLMKKGAVKVSGLKDLLKTFTLTWGQILIFQLLYIIPMAFEPQGSMAVLVLVLMLISPFLMALVSFNLMYHGHIRVNHGVKANKPPLINLLARLTAVGLFLSMGYGFSLNQGIPQVLYSFIIQFGWYGQTLTSQMTNFNVFILVAVFPTFYGLLVCNFVKNDPTDLTQKIHRIEGDPYD